MRCAENKYHFCLYNDMFGAPAGGVFVIIASASLPREEETREAERARLGLNHKRELQELRARWYGISVDEDLPPGSRFCLVARLSAHLSLSLSLFPISRYLHSTDLSCSSQ